VRIVDFDFTKFINFEAEVAFPEEEGVVQIENFGASQPPLLAHVVLLR
jgi:hypothetical protein